MPSDYYSSIAKGYDALHKEEQLRKLRIIARHIKPKAPLLDIGAGTGISTSFFRVKAVALEPSEEMLKQYKGEKVIAKAESIPFPDKYFNTIISITALHHADIEKAIKEIKRVSNDGCIYAFTILKKAANAVEIKEKLEKAFCLEEINEDEKDYILISKK
ncbi:MAG: class I SAM-dependent methyltransferase [Candidatus Nanoarchaeia archaeon]|nr:class I SAM-dependent methyltransferase [Candidatus Nanoarchaeia archaeon]